MHADLVGFTELSRNLPPRDLVILLNDLFSRFDTLVEKHGAEKIKTIGDAYMVAAGMPRECENPEKRMADMALDMVDAVQAMSKDSGQDVRLRVGFHAGPVVAGVIGSRKPFYDVWGETVNVAARMESHGKTNRIQTTESTRQLLDDCYEFQHRGMVEIKGMGPTETWWLTGKKQH
jgi:adenylate cyclase